MLDELLFGDPIRRLTSGLIVLLVAGVAVLAAARRARRSGSRLINERLLLGVALSFTPVGIGILFSGVWGALGALVFALVAMAVCGVVVLVSLARGT